MLSRYEERAQARAPQRSSFRERLIGIADDHLCSASEEAHFRIKVDTMSAEVVFN